jgi:hypothetical protein
MNVSFADLVEAVREFVQAPETVLPIIRREVNAEYKRLARSANLSETQGYLNESVALVSGQAYLALPGDAVGIVSISDKTNEFSLRRKDLKHALQDAVYRIDTTGDVLYYAELGYRATKRPLSVNDQVRIQASAGLTIEATVRVRGLQATTNIPTFDTLTTSGTSGVDGTEQFRLGWSIDSIGTDGTVDAGYITITEKTTTANVLGYIPKGEKQSRFYVLHLENPPDAGDNLNIVYLKGLRDLEVDDDVIAIPEMAEAIVEGAIAKMRMHDRAYDQGAMHASTALQHRQAVLFERESKGEQGAHQARPDLRGRGFRRAY